MFFLSKNVVFLLSFVAITFFSSVAISKKKVVHDSHFHMVSKVNYEKLKLHLGHHMVKKPVGAKETLAIMDKAGIKKAIVLSSAYLLRTYEDQKKENDFVSKETASSPRLYGLCGLRFHAKEVFQEIERCFRKLGMLGAKIHLTANNIDLHKPKNQMRLLKIFQKIGKEKPYAPIVIDHLWMDDMATFLLAKIALRSQQVNVIFAHACGHHYRELRFIQALFKVLPPQVRRNIFVDISASMNLFAKKNGSYKDYIFHLREFGFDYVLFGSDFPAFHPREALKVLRKFRLRRKEFAKVTRLNFEKLIQQTRKK